MTHSLEFAAISSSELFRGASANFVEDLFARKQAQLPLLLMSRKEIVRNYRLLNEALPRAEIHYAVKSNNHQVMIDQVAQLGGSFDICSKAEIESAVRSGVPAHKLIHSHPIKTVPEFDYAVGQGLEIFVVDNPEEIKKFARYANRKPKVLIRYRINTNSTAVVNLQYKFGCAADEVLTLARLIREAGHEFHGLCFHIGSQCVFNENYVTAIQTASELMGALSAEGFETKLLDIGGGFPVPYVEPIPPIDEFCQPIQKTLDNLIPKNIRIVCEPGRFISASPTTLVCTVIGKAVRQGKIWYYLDDGLYSTFSGIVFDHCQYPVVTDKSGDGKLSVLAGPTCDSFDVMYDGLMIPEHDIGDVMVFPLTGAYCAVSGSDFNSLKRPDYIIVD